MTPVLEKPHPTRSASDERRWARVIARDKAADDQFFTAVLTTGIYCRPSCPARHPNPVNVRFYDTREEAEAAGFRPCKRCKPDQPPPAAMVAEACRRIEAAVEPPQLAELAARAGLSPFHFHRLFKAIAGVTPKAYAMAHRQKRVRAALERSPTVTNAIYDAGYASSGRFYASSSDMLGMTPAEFRAGGANAEIRYSVGSCWLGRILVAATEKGVSAIMLGDDPKALVAELKERFPRARLVGGDRAFEEMTAKVIAFVETPGSSFGLPLDVAGTAFQHRVWQALRGIPAGSTLSYTEMARRIGAPGAVRAVAGACAANPVAVAIPCHRVVRTDGSLSGYRWGVARKRALLDREKKA